MTSPVPRRRKPARLQAGEFAIVMQSGQRAIDGIAQRPIVLGESDAEFLVGRDLHRDRQLRAVPYQPRDHRKELDHETDASSFEVVEGDTDPIIGIVLEAGDRAFRQETLGNEIGRMPDWMPAVRPRKPATDETSGVNRRFTATP